MAMLNNERVIINCLKAGYSTQNKKQSSAAICWHTPHVWTKPFKKGEVLS